MSNQPPAPEPGPPGDAPAALAGSALPASGPAAEPVPAAVAADDASCALRVPAVLEAPRIVRAGLRQWLAGVSWPQDPADEIVLAVSEAVSNAVEHAYPQVGPADQGVEVDAVVEESDEGRRVRVRIRDHGAWTMRPADEEPTNRRRGLPLMTMLMEDVLVVPGGTPADAGDEQPGIAAEVVEAVVEAVVKAGGGVAPPTGTEIVLLSPPVPR
ncbi:hypothetical protein GCM10009836_32160 [Pseudonocardia ailaonensis]|uniref:Histidine kinase/HSP90-like ATPase domain-containing protein n=1 Tax=Pseudonocardia ailaonensis TaxID=367279 RepID=A0ABN2N3N3_9PSEU